VALFAYGLLYLAETKELGILYFPIKINNLKFLKSLATSITTKNIEIFFVCFVAPFKSKNFFSPPKKTVLWC
jgi:hypothetical protein